MVKRPIEVSVPPVIGAHTSAAGQAPEQQFGASAGDLVPGDELGLDDLLPMAIPETARRGAGRPAGARNIRTELTARAAIGRYGDPLMATVALGNMPLDALVTWLRTTASDCGMRVGKDVGVFDLLKFQEECRRNALPYLHAKRASTDEKGDPVPPTVLAIGTFQQTNVQVNAGARSIEDVVDNQMVIEHEEDKSHDDKSHDADSDDGSTA